MVVDDNAGGAIVGLDGYICMCTNYGYSAKQYMGNYVLQNANMTNKSKQQQQPQFVHVINGLIESRQLYQQTVNCNHTNLERKFSETNNIIVVSPSAKRAEHHHERQFRKYGVSIFF